MKGVLYFATRGEDNFVTSGYNNWKKARERFLKHEQSGLHKEAILKIELLKQESIAATLSSQVKADQKHRREMLLKQLTSLKYLAKQGLAIRRNNDMEGNLLQLLQLRSEDCQGLSRWVDERKYFSPDILNEQIRINGPQKGS